VIHGIPSADATSETGAAPERAIDEAHDLAGGALRGSIRSLRAATAFLTRIPVADPGPLTGAPAFGLVGGLIGSAGAIPILLLGDAAPTIAAILAVGAVTALSGAIHLDGLADTADALVAVGPDAAERARKDPAIGTAGAVSLILVIGLDVAALAAVLASAGSIVAALTCVVAAAVSRAVPPAVARVAPRSMTSSGLAASFGARVTTRDVAVGLATAAAIALSVALAAERAELLVAGIAGVAIGIGASVELARVRHQVDGDLLGAGVELAQAGCLVVAAVLVSWPR
jgi:adenosylcobinamide-GDP ribazoletransferase